MRARRSVLAWLAGAACAMSAPDTSLAGQPQPSAADGGLAAIATLTGTCERLVVAGEEKTDGCRAMIGNTIYRTGRSGFTFFVDGDSGLVLTFSGADSAAEGDQATIVLDKIVFTPTGPLQETTVLRAAGRCTYTNPYIGPSRVDCSASTESGRYSATFISDGRPPEGEQP